MRGLNSGGTRGFSRLVVCQGRETTDNKRWQTLFKCRMDANGYVKGLTCGLKRRSASPKLTATAWPTTSGCPLSRVLWTSGRTAVLTLDLSVIHLHHYEWAQTTVTYYAVAGRDVASVGMKHQYHGPRQLCGHVQCHCQYSAPGYHRCQLCNADRDTHDSPTTASHRNDRPHAQSYRHLHALAFPHNTHFGLRQAV